MIVGAPPATGIIDIRNLRPGTLLVSDPVRNPEIPVTVGDLDLEICRKHLLGIKRLGFEAAPKIMDCEVTFEK